MSERGCCASLLPAQAEEWPVWPVGLVCGNFQAGNLALALEDCEGELWRGFSWPGRGWQAVSLLRPLSAAGNHVSSAASDKEGGERYPHLPSNGFYHLSPYQWRTSVWGLRSHCAASARPCGTRAHSWIARESFCRAMLAAGAWGQASRSHEIRQKALLPEGNTRPKWGRRSSHVCSWMQVTREWCGPDYSQGSCPCALQVYVITLHVYPSSSARPVAGSPAGAVARMPARRAACIPSPVAQAAGDAELHRPPAFPACSPLLRLGLIRELEAIIFKEEKQIL